MIKKSKLSVAVAGVISTIVSSQALSQEQSVEEVVVTGIRGSLQRAMDIKRDAAGVVDAISAEDMGKFPDTNLAESLQRITGVSINRVNGEGSEVTVRGFGGNFNLVTVNGRQLPSANVASITGNPLDQGASGTSRSFDFSNLASEGVSALQVYKTARAAVPTGGVGATINVQTLKPLDGENKVTIGVKAMDDQSGDDITPEASGLVSWANDDSTFGVTVFGSYAERDSGSRHMSIERYDLDVWGSESLTTLGMQDANITNEPTDGQLVAIPSNIGLGVNHDERERTNGSITLQFAPSDTLTLTADVLYATNSRESTAVVDGIWFARQFTDVEFDGDSVVATPITLIEDIDGGKDFFFQNLLLATEDELTAVGFNADWEMSDRVKLRFDVSTAEAESRGDGPFGQNATRFNVAGAVAGWQAADFSGSMPKASIVIDDSIKGNNNGIFDFPDTGTQVTRGITSNQKTTTDQFRFDGTWDVQEGVVVDFGMGYIAVEMEQELLNSQAVLGGWGVDAPGDIPEGLIQQTCTGCEFEDHDPLEGFPGADAIAQPPGSSTVALGSVSWVGDAAALQQMFGSIYDYTPGALPEITSSSNNLVEEDIFSTYAQVTLDGDLGDLPTNVVLGIRYERTTVDSSARQTVPTSIRWTADNDFGFGPESDTPLNLADDNVYENFLPSIDFSLDVTEDIKARASFGQTIARPNYSQMFTATTLNLPNRPTFLGGAASGDVGNARLEPLKSNNFDLSVEYYYGESSMVSAGYYQKNVANFVGTEQVALPLFGLLDPTSGEPGTLSGDAIEALEDLGVPVTERNFFTMTAVLDNPDAYPGGAADFEESQVFADEVFSTYDVEARPGDPAFLFEVTQPINSQSARIYGYEFALQHFFGETGFGIQANYTTVEGDIGFDPGSDPTIDQFALEGLSDSANLVFIYENYGLSARLLYNWRDEFLDEVNRSVSSVRNPLFIAEFEQWDANFSYEFNENFSISLDIINLGEEGSRQFGRTKTDVFFIQELDTRYVLGFRYTM